MLLHRDGLIELNYEATSDILSVKWPDMANSSLSEIEHSITKLIDTLKHFDIKNLLIDGRDTSIEVTDEEHRAISLRFAQNLTATRLKRIARIASTDKQRESKSKVAAEEIQKEMSLPFVSQTFEAEEEAISWLKS